MRVAGKLMEIEIIILSKVTDSENTNVSCFHSSVDVSIETLEMCVSFGMPIDLRKLLPGHGEGISRRGDRTPQCKRLNNDETVRFKLRLVHRVQGRGGSRRRNKQHCVGFP